ncbi:MAG: BrnT family toxin [Deltaproteobacteria bacterium]|nr:BrnT family toxin [Deltaproteobacteria bacterium]
MRFEWDPRKAAANLLAHEVSFAEAVTVFDDDFGLTREDEDVSTERRFVTLALSDRASLLVVVYTYRERDVIRIISAWKANRRQRLLYEENRG